MKQVASLRYGVVFKKAFCDPEIFTAFVRDILEVEIEINERETACNLLALGTLSTDQVANIVGLSLTEVNQLA